MKRLGHEDYQILSRERCFQGYFAIDKYQLRHRLFEGGWSEPYYRELFERGHAAAVVLYDPVMQAVVLLEQFRIGALTSETSPWMLEIVAGIIEQDESAEQVAIREAYEEAGQIIDNLFFIGRYFCTPGASSESIYLYCARVDAEQVEGVFGLEHEQEDIRVFSLTLAEVREGLNQGQFENATSIIGMQWLLLNHQMLESRWLD